ncbi:formate dehydrogenase subunit alpha [Dissulfurirhabdus thermomarina]|uniref:Formate dehydrogenase subunit alpha n=1 Tax=Dissulfurirhabdus thermomarina TaxID=1765737 RepID=A0A6N9TMF2_DISTH|nr:formate dehydrogenase subunit alpha [Dissulfurirhabdus thermomarina]NDY42425.1 formate dehydrogenase subunit alpha [Dissulfurirhabdus thermomarina]NMX23551.1 formate dehydrogenase subunit alpha [Dissulfurirhabdus thermomarina]
MTARRRHHRCRIDGREIRVAPGTTIRAAAADIGIEIPGLCHLEGRPDADFPCLICMVEADGRLVRSCQTPVADGMEIRTASPAVECHRRQRLEFLSSFHYGDCKPPCTLACPAGINVQGYIRYIARGEYGAALDLIREKNPLPGIVCRVCPRFCESRCRRTLVDEPIAINHLKRFAVENGRETAPPIVPGPPTGFSVAVIGGGPAGLSCAWYLRRFGHDVTLFEATSRLGGMPAAAIPTFKLPAAEVTREVEQVIGLGVHVRLGKRWGRDFSLADLLDGGFHAVFLATGIPGQGPLEVPGAAHTRDALAFLKEVRAGRPPAIGDKVLVLGGGRIAVETARCARRAGAAQVTVVHPRARVELGAPQRDIAEAEREGVQFFLMAQPLRLTRDGARIRVELARTLLGPPDRRGTRQPVVQEGSSLWWEGETVFAAPGQASDGAFTSYGRIEARLALTPRQTLKVHPATLRTNIDRVYAGGDLTSGPRTVIQAVAAGRRAAEAIHEDLTGTPAARPLDGRINFSRGRRFEEVAMVNFAGRAIALQESPPVRPPERRIGDFDPVDLGYSEEMAVREAKRCLQCGCMGLAKCGLRPLLNTYGVQPKAAPRRPRADIDDRHPFIRIDPNRCIGCQRCQRSCEFEALTVKVREVEDGLPNPSLSISPSCVACGACVDACPTGALTKKDLPAPFLPGETATVRSVCTYCGTGCAVDLHVKNGILQEVTADRSQPPNHGDLCVKGRFGFDFHRHPDRLIQPLVRESVEAPWRPATWDEALAMAAAGLKKALAEYGPEGVGVLASSRCENEAAYVAQKFARVVLRTNNVDNCARVCHAPSVSGLRIALGSGAATNPLESIELAEVLLVCGSNTTEAHPVVGLKIRRAIRRGARLVVIDPRRTELADMADIWLSPLPGTNVLLLNALVHVILDEGLENKEFIAARTENIEPVRAHVRSFSPEATAAATGVDPARVRQAARLYGATRRGMILYGLGVTEHRNGTLGVMALANLALATGNIGRPGAGICPLRGQNNVQGSCDMGALPYVYPGYQDVADPAVRRRLGRAWGVELPATAGMTEPEMYEAARRDRFKALYCIGYDPLQTQADLHAVRKAFARMDLVVVQDLFLTKTAELAHVVLPAACFYEKDGTFTNAERRIQRIRKAVAPPGAALPDWQITCRLAEAMGHPMHYEGPEEIWREIARITPSMGGVRYRRLEGAGLIWPCPNTRHPGTPILHADTFTRGRGRFSVLTDVPPLEAPDEAFPFRLITGRRRAHYNNGSMTRRCRGLSALVPEETLEIHPDDAKRLGITNGMEVEVRSRRGAVRLPAAITDRSRPGTVFCSFHFDRPEINTLTSPGLDEISHTPEYKVCAVAVAPARPDAGPQEDAHDR